MGLEIIRGGKERLVGGNQRHLALIGKRNHPGFIRTVKSTLALQFDIEPVAKHRLEAVKPASCPLRMPLAHGLINRPAGRTCQGNQSLRALFKPRQRDMRPVAAVAVEISLADQRHQPVVAGGGGGEQDDMRRLLQMIAVGPAFSVLNVFHVDIELAADQRLNSRFHGLDRKFQCAKQIVGVADGKRRLIIGHRPLDQGLDRQRALKQRIGRMNPQMHKTRPAFGATAVGVLAPLTRLLRARSQIGQHLG